MSDILSLRARVRALQPVTDAAQQKLALLQAELDDAEANRDLPPKSLEFLRGEVLAQGKVVTRLTTELDDAVAAYQAAVQADPLHTLDAGLPILLLPVRIETAYLPNAAGSGIDLVVRVYPDDIHVDAHEPALTAAELAAGTQYWNAVWGAGPNAARLDAAWQAVLARVAPDRAAWVVQALAPAAPRPTVETPPDQPQPEPALPSVATREATFTRAARTMLLPDHWLVLGFRNGAEVFDVAGTAIPDGLDLSFGPPGTGADGAPDGASALPFGANSRWLVDLDAAIAVGMALRIPMSGPDYTLDQLYVIGVNTSLAPADAAGRLDTLLTAHQYTNGLEFLPPGTPTNNTSTTRSAWQSAALPPTPTAVEQARAGYVAASAQNAALTAGALGVDGSAVLAIAPHALDDQLTPVQTLHRQFWPALGGRALSMLYDQWDVAPGHAGPDWNRHDDPVASAMLYEHATSWVLSRGSLPVLRVGRQPYGLLPVSSLADWAPAAGETTGIIVDWLRRLRPYWLAGVGAVPHVVPGLDDPDATVVAMLQRLPVSPGLNARADGDPIDLEVSGKNFPQAVIPGLPMTSEMYFATPAATAEPLRVNVVQDIGGDMAVLALWQKFFEDTLRLFQQKGTDDSTWYYDRYQAWYDADTLPQAPPPDLFVSMLLDSLSDPLVDENDRAFDMFVMGGRFWSTQQDNQTFTDNVKRLQPACASLVATFQATCALGASNPGLYAQVLPELLDLYSHRYDAWVTSLASRRLARLRTAKPGGIVIGAYGWVENLAPRADLLPAAPVSANPVYIHAPSLQHAATAAVLRAGFDSHHDADALAVNLTSRRVRTADVLADGIRNGQTLGALLGYQFERGLQDAGRDDLIEGLRKDHPLPLLTAPDGDVNGAAAREAIAARNVVDGLNLYRQRAQVSADYSAEPVVLKLLQDLEHALDALGDLLLAESVHQLVGGNPLRAGLAADTVGRGEPLPDRFDGVRTPRSARTLTWQLGMLVPSAWRAAVPGWNAARPRARLEPHLDGWVASLLGDASRYRLVCGTVDASGAVAEVVIGADALGLAALDVLAEAGGAPSLLERRIADAVAATQPDGGQVSVRTAPNADGSLGYAELAGLAARLGLLLGKATPIGPRQMQGPDAAATQGLDTTEIATRVQTLHASLAGAVGVLAALLQPPQTASNADSPGVVAAAGDASLRKALVALTDHGIAIAYPGAAPLGEQAESVLATVQALAATSVPPTPPTGAGDDTVQRWLGALGDFVRPIAGQLIPLLPCFAWTPAAAAALDPANAPTGADVPAIGAWLRRIAQVRPAGGALHDTLLAAETLGAAAPAFVATQLPAASGAAWAALPFAGAAPMRARLAGLWCAPAPIDPAAPACGLLFDHWTEAVPGLTGVADPALGYEPAEVTGIAFSVDAPDASAPQAMLLAVAPDAAHGWSLDILFDVLQETLELAKLRGVDLGDLPRLGRVLPVLHTGSGVDKLLFSVGQPS